MKVSRLIEMLKNQNPDDEVVCWADDELAEVTTATASNSECYNVGTDEAVGPVVILGQD